VHLSVRYGIGMLWGQGYSSDALPLYLYFVLQVCDNKHMQLRSSS